MSRELIQWISLVVIISRIPHPTDLQAQRPMSPRLKNISYTAQDVRRGWCRDARFAIFPSRCSRTSWFLIYQCRLLECLRTEMADPFISARKASIARFPFGFGAPVLGGGEGALAVGYCSIRIEFHNTSDGLTLDCDIAEGPVGGPLDGPAGGLNGLGAPKAGPAGTPTSSVEYRYIFWVLCKPRNSPPALTNPEPLVAPTPYWGFSNASSYSCITRACALSQYQP